MLPQLVGPVLLSTSMPTQLIGGRLTIDNTNKAPVPTSDLTGKTTIYYVPYVGRTIMLWDGTSWIPTSIPDAGTSVALGTLSSATTYDVFGYLSGGSLALELSAAWTTSAGATAARSSTLTVTDGVYTKSTDKTRLYLGTFYTTATTTTEDSAARRYLWNAYNRVPRKLYAQDTTASWTYTTATFRAANANTTDGQGRFNVVVGLAGDVLDVKALRFAGNGSSTNVALGVGIDSTSTNSADMSGTQINTGATVVAFYTGAMGIGQHYIQCLEYSGATGTTTWYGVPGVPLNSGMSGVCLA